MVMTTLYQSFWSDIFGTTLLSPGKGGQLNGKACMSETEQRQNIMSLAAKEYRHNNFAQAELLCRYLLSNYGGHVDALNLLGMVAMKVKRADIAKRYFERALVMQPRSSMLIKNLTSANDLLRESEPASADQDNGRIRYHVIKSWGCGFWSDVNQVLGHLLLAEITKRRPLVLWGSNSLFSESTNDNAFEYFFDVASPVTLQDVTQAGQTYFPPKWNRENITVNDINKWNGPYSRMAGLYYLNCTDTVTVGDFSALVTDLVGWLPKSHPMYGQSITKHYRHLFQRYLHPRARYIHMANNFYLEHLSRYTSLAVHMRGSDKVFECSQLEAMNQAYPGHIDAFLRIYPDARIFLLTDSSTIHKKFCQRYHDHVVSSKCTRTEDEQGVHFLPCASRREIGGEVLIDALIAHQCDYFIGNGHSSVSNAIYHLKDWNTGSAKLLGGCRWYQSNLSLYDRGGEWSYN